MSAPSIERAVMRSYLGIILGVALVILSLSAAMTTLIMIKRDDDQAKALALTLGSELAAEESNSDEVLAELIQHELEEQHWFGRTTEVWRRGRVRLGTAAAPTTLAGHPTARDQEVDPKPLPDRSGCHLTRARSWSRVCAVPTVKDCVVFVSTPLLPLLQASLPLLAAVGLASLLAALLFSAAAGRWVRASLAPLRAFENAVAALPGAQGQSISATFGAREIDQLAHTFNGLLARVDEMIAREQRFVEDAAHELRTPLTRLRGQLELVVTEPSLDIEARERIGLAGQSALELSQSLDCLLALARNEAPVGATVGLSELAQEVVDALDPTPRERVHLQLSSVHVRADEALVKLALRNLLDNALKYSTGPIEISVEEQPEQCLLVVQDHGPGIDASERVRVREPFVRGGAARPSIRGVGLGLTLVEHVAHLHAGRLDLEAGPRGGLRATLHLPAWTAQRRDRSTREPPNVGTQHGLSKPRAPAR